MNNFYSRFSGLIILTLSLLINVNVYGDGSKDLYPSGVNGYRAYLLSNDRQVSGAIPFASRGTHYVYAKAGETIALASSEWSGSAAIKLFDPENNDVTPTRGSNGRIENRNQELAGPKLTTADATSNRYTPIYYSVQKEGIFRVEFWPRTNVTSNYSNATRAGVANGEWTNWNTGSQSSSYIAAWDISVINNAKTGFIVGRVYANILNMGILASSNVNEGWYGKMYVLTKDGYTYLVDNNGNNGIVFSFFVNNNGFVKGNNGVTNGTVDYTPLYKSLNAIDNAVTNKQIWNPTALDNEQNITHKIFYRLPSEDLPKVITKGAVPGGETWLKNNVIVPNDESLEIIGADGSIGQVSRKGGYIQFNTGSQGSYIVEILSAETPAAFPARYLRGTAIAGLNKVFWDGKDGDGNLLPVGLAPAKITVELQGAEVHFPYFDMENNINGIKLKLLDHEKLPGQEVVQSDIVYWNDKDLDDAKYGVSSSPKNNSHLPLSLGGANSIGIRSDGPNANGHKWGGSGTTETFGDVRSMDTWTFIKGEKKTVDGIVTVKIADLKISDIKVNDANNATVDLGEELTYTIKVKNDGPSDVLKAPFAFTLPEGVTGTDTHMFHSSGCGSEEVSISYDPTKRQYTSKLNLPNGCEITYTFTATIEDTAEPGNLKADATILRPNDVTDPDATNISDPENSRAPVDAENPLDLTKWYIPPTDPYFECVNNFPIGDPQRGICNNIKDINVTLMRQTDLAIEKTVNESNPEVGNSVTFTLKITNHGPHSASNIIVNDIVPDGYTIGVIDNGGTRIENTITWNIASLAKDANTSVTFTAIVNTSGNYLNTASVTGDGIDLFPENNTDTETVNPCQEVNLFFEDFGVSEFPEVSNNFGRLTSPYMPSNSFKFGTPYPLTEEYDKYAIDNNHYAVVAPGYIKMGHRENQYYFWTPSYNESNTVHDRSGTQDGAVMVVNAGQVLDSFYKRPQLLQVGASYRASFWLYLVKGPSQVGIDILHQKTNEVLATIESQTLEDWDVNVKHKWNYLEVYFTVPLPDDDKECNVDNIIISFRNNLKENQGNDYYIDDISLDKVCSVPDGTPIINCPDPNYKKNYWHGTVDNKWTNIDNWTAEFVPATGEDIEFATDDNNGSSGNGNGLGTAIRDLHLDTDREIGDLINNSNVDLLVTTENQLTINGVVKDDNPNKGTIVVKTSTNKPTGTLLFSNPSDNRHVNATVEFYNKAYECATCGFYRKQWQYFGIPVQLSYFPYLSPQVETVNQWVEPYIYSNKWRPAPYTPDLTLKAFKGYEMTNSNDTEPTHIYSFPGILNVGDATVGVTKTANVDYSGMNLLSNSFTAAIPITSAAIALGSVELKSNTVYLFNMGTRDQWRKLNGGSAYGVAAGQYQAVPFNLAGQAGIPDRILSMHTFMLDVKTPGNITLKYDKLLKNELNASTVKPWKSAELRSSTIQLPHIVMDVISNGSADRVWLFEEADATTEFDNGWDGYKMKEGDLIQTYVLGSDQSDYQIATVPEIIGTTIGVSSGLNENYSINFSVTPDVESRNLFLRDLFTGRNYSIKNNAEYVINGTNNSNNNRFKIVASSSSLIDEDIMSSPINIYVMNNIIIVDNQSEEDCSVMVYDLMGRLVANKQAPKSQITEFTNINQNKTGVYIVKVLGESNSINKTDRVLLR